MEGAHLGWPQEPEDDRSVQEMRPKESTALEPAHLWLAMESAEAGTALPA